MKSLFKKIRGNKKGFTLAELLVVVAIVGILVAISVPVFTAQLGKARRATNNANLRAAKAAAVAEYLSDENTRGTEPSCYKYEVDSGVISSESKDKCTGTAVVVNTDDVSKDKIYKEIYVKVTPAEGTKASDSVDLYPVTPAN
ncbi:type II secretion system protein [Clostridium sp. AM42-4]|uniref:type IV pilin protein n=1 Tax=Clostridium sp. AM42-4 TaxID=2292305 RepID=UPI000E486DB1|nr:type II secretion system protein [Clostridium sp. AM42-4]RHS84837.1 type II secretion system protein [Clostridium sp. AM42-4]